VIIDLAVAGLDAEKGERYLKSLLGKDIALLSLAHLGEPPDEALGKSYGYGAPVRIHYRAANGEHRRAVPHTMSPGPFGHEHMADRSLTLIWSHHAFNRLPLHVQSLDVGGFVLFASGIGFRVLDRSRGEYGDPADGVTSLSLNYVFFSLQRSGRLEGGFETLFLRFWERYLEKSGDREMLQVVAPFLVFRALVMASPVWYPTLSESARRGLLAFIAYLKAPPSILCR
jgi:hypothetical protein